MNTCLYLVFPPPSPPLSMLGTSCRWHIHITIYYMNYLWYFALRANFRMVYKTYVKSGNGAFQNQHRVWAVLILTKPENSLYSRYINPIPTWPRILAHISKKVRKDDLLNCLLLSSFRYFKCFTTISFSSAEVRRVFMLLHLWNHPRKLCTIALSIYRPYSTRFQGQCKALYCKTI